MSFLRHLQESSCCKVIDLDVSSVYAEGGKAGYITDFFHKLHFAHASDANLVIRAQEDLTEQMAYIPQNHAVTTEKYVIEYSFTNDKLIACVKFSGDRGLYYALWDIARCVQSGSFPLGTITEYPLFSTRGYIEGFYGKPWSTEQRLQMMSFLSAFRMNTYYYAPKDDPYHRERWSELYPDEGLQNLKSVVAHAQKCQMDFWFCLAPGLDMCYSDEKQFDLLIQKFRQLYSIGITHFALLLDDIPQDLYFEADRNRFKDTVCAHIDLTNRVYAALRKMDNRIRMTICPMEYHGKGDSYYISELGQQIDERIQMFWTGYNICSQELTVPEAIHFTEHTRHRPLYWDNYPVNDAEMYNEMHLGWYGGRDPYLYRYCNGIIVNCMPYFECNKIPLLTIADYLWNPLDYNPEQSWRFALEQVMGKEADVLVYFAEHLTTSCLKNEVSPRMNEALTNFDRARRVMGVKAAALHLDTYLQQLEKCCVLLEMRKGEPLYIELSRWIEKFIVLKDTISLCSMYLHSGDSTLKAQIAAKLYSFMRLPEVMTDFCFQMTVDNILNLEV